MGSIEKQGPCETHSTDEELAADARRTAFLNAQGYAVMRFTNQQLYENADAVAEAILAVLVENSGQSPMPLTQPLPARGERGSPGLATDFRRRKGLRSKGAARVVKVLMSAHGGRAVESEGSKKSRVRRLGD